jgi:hypothetical protein
VSINEELPDANALLEAFRKACDAYERGISQMSKDHAALTAMGTAARLDRLLSGGGHLPEEWRNALR